MRQAAPTISAAVATCAAVAICAAVPVTIAHSLVAATLVDLAMQSLFVHSRRVGS